MGCGNSTNEVVENKIELIKLPEPEEEGEENTDDSYRFLKTKFMIMALIIQMVKKKVEK